MTQEAAVLFVNEAFYEAFQARDMVTMDSLWARDFPVVCIHPGWRALMGRDQVMQSWEGILSNERAPDIASGEAQAFMLGDSAFVVCYEVIGETVLVATNTFRQEAGAWKIVLHQAGPCDLTADVVMTEEEPNSIQ